MQVVWKPLMRERIQSDVELRIKARRIGVEISLDELLEIPFDFGIVDLSQYLA
jgi:hypothetical protein